jgi:hypothetical protein
MLLNLDLRVRIVHLLNSKNKIWPYNIPIPRFEVFFPSKSRTVLILKVFIYKLEINNYLFFKVIEYIS